MKASSNVLILVAVAALMACASCRTIPEDVIERLPISVRGKAGFRGWLYQPYHKAFAVDPEKGKSGWSQWYYTVEGAKERALRNCTRIGGSCKIIAINDEIVAPELLLEERKEANLSQEEVDSQVDQIGGGDFSPPPRGIDGILKLLNEAEDRERARRAKLNQLVTQPAPADGSPDDLRRFFKNRGLHARQIGESGQWIQDLRRSAEYAEKVSNNRNIANAYWNLAVAELWAGTLSSSTQALNKSISATSCSVGQPQCETHWHVIWFAQLCINSAFIGNLDVARKYLNEAIRIQGILEKDEDLSLVRDYMVNIAQGRIYSHSGKLEEARSSYSEAVSATQSARYPPAWKVTRPIALIHLAEILSRNNEFAHAEHLALRALEDVLDFQGRYSAYTAWVLGHLTNIIAEQGRLKDAETLTRETLEMFEESQSIEGNVFAAGARLRLADLLGARGRWKEALVEIRRLKADFAKDLKTLSAFFKSQVSPAVVYLKTEQGDEALSHLNSLLETKQLLLGDDHYEIGEIRGLLAAAKAQLGDKTGAQEDFRAATSILLSSEELRRSNGAPPYSREVRLRLIVDAYLKGISSYGLDI